MNLRSGALQTVGDSIGAWDATGAEWERGGEYGRQFSRKPRPIAASFCTVTIWCRYVVTPVQNVSLSMDIYDPINTIGSLDETLAIQLQQLLMMLQIYVIVMRPAH